MVMSCESLFHCVDVHLQSCRVFLEFPQLNLLASAKMEHVKNNLIPMIQCENVYASSSLGVNICCPSFIPK